MDERRFYVYEHIRPDRGSDGEVFYVGKGRGKRANVLYGRNRHHQAIQAKLSRLGLCVEVRLVETGLTEDEAFALEIERIAYWTADGCDLTNMTAGGEGCSGASEETRELMRAAKLGGKLSDEHKAKISAASRRVAQDPDYRAKLRESIRAAQATPEFKAKMSASQKARVRTKEHYEKVAAALRGKKLSPEHIEKMRIAATGRKHSQETIEKRRAANKGRKRSAEFCAQMKEFHSDPARRAAKSARQSIAIVCVTNGTTYPSARAAAEALGVDYSMVTKVCKGKHSGTKGYSFRYAENKTEVKVK